jgi:hypothetical protein
MDAVRSAREEAFLEVRRQPRLDELEIQDRLERATSIGSWEALSPSLSIERGSPPPCLEDAPIGEERRADLARRLAREGYFNTGPVLSAGVIGAMRGAMEALKENGWPPVFAYVYDEFWEVLRAPSLSALFTAALGPGYRQSPRVWAFHLATEKGSSGWPPHVDGGHGTHTTDRLTVWLSISDTTLDNGCIYIVPKHLVPSFIPDDFANNPGGISPEVWRTMLQGSRALPAPACSVLCWDFQVIHWSSLCDGAREPRMSLAVELIGATAEPSDSELPLLDPGSLPPFRERLRAIAKGILSYQRFEPAMVRYMGLARRMLDRLDLEEP